MVNIREWNYNKLQKHITIIKGKTPDNIFEEKKENRVPYLLASNIRENKYDKWIEKTKKVELVQAEDIVIIWDGSNSGEVFTGIDGALASTMARLSPDEELQKSYLHSFLQTQFRILNTRTAGSTIPHISRGVLENLKIPVPPLVEQRGIVEVLRTVDECIRLTDAVIERAEELKRGLMQQLLTRGIGHTEYKETLLGEIPKTWKIQTLQSLIDKNIIISHLDGNHGSSYPRSSEFVDKGVPYISANCLLNNEINFSKCKYLTEERANKLTKGIAQDGDVLLAHNATVGPSAILKTTYPKVILSTSLTYYRCNEELVNSKYLHNYLNSWTFQKQLKRIMMQTTRNQVPITAQRTLHFILPLLNEQDNIVRILDPYINKIRNEEERKEKLLVLKQGLLQLLLSGKIRVELKGDELHRIGDSREANN